RLTTSGIYVLQCGDPTGTGNGGPGYKFANENTSGARYTTGTVAMANAGPGTNGSQFFLVYRDSLSLHPDYTPFGTVVKGLGIPKNRHKAATDTASGPGDAHPKETVQKKRLTIKKPGPRLITGVRPSRRFAVSTANDPWGRVDAEGTV